MCQPEFCCGAPWASKEYGINTAMESTGFAKCDIIEQYLPYLDLYLMDIKHMQSKKHEQFTSRPNELILENAKKIAEKAKQLIIRVPVVPTFNDTESEILEIARFAASLPNVNELHLLPYHRLGRTSIKDWGELMMPELPPRRQKRCSGCWMRFWRKD